MKTVSVVGARPQFIKAATLSRAIARHNEHGRQPRVEEVLVHTGQHFDASMSQVFFDELAIPPPRHHLEIAGLSHGAMTGRMLEALETVLLAEQPDWVVIYGDTNSTLAAALAAVKLHLRIAHVEAGLRSFNMRMPEEVNRIVADRLSNLLLCPTAQAMQNLAAEGLSRGARNVGDVMYDATVRYRELARERCSLERWQVEDANYVLCTVHRAENTDDPRRFAEIWSALRRIARSVRIVFPVHPRTRKRFSAEIAGAQAEGIAIIEPVSYLEMTRLEMSAKAILTDSGGVQKEAFFHRVPCLTLRDETEWVETTQLGWNVLCGADAVRIQECWEALGDMPCIADVNPYGRADAAQQVLSELLGFE